MNQRAAISLRLYNQATSGPLLCLLSKTEKKVQKICFAAAALILTVTAVAYFVSYYSGKEKTADESFPLMQEELLSSNLAKTQSRSDVRGSGEDEPLPLVQDLSQQKTGVVVLSNTLEGDTFVLNGDTLQLVQRGDEAVIAVVPGSHKLRLYRSDGTVFSKEIEIMPYQKWQWNL